jgi:hypothetical protein
MIYLIIAMITIAVSAGWALIIGAEKQGDDNDIEFP